MDYPNPGKNWVGKGKRQEKGTNRGITIQLDIK